MRHSVALFYMQEMKLFMVRTAFAIFTQNQHLSSILSSRIGFVNKIRNSPAKLRLKPTSFINVIPAIFGRESIMAVKLK